MTAHRDHAVQFYEEDAFLAESVAEFVEGGLEQGLPALILATPDHREALVASLAARGRDAGDAIASGMLTLLDAREVLARFLEDGVPNAERFHAEVGGLLRAARGDRPGLRAFGEMVDLLWRDGNPAAVRRVEALWNEIMAGESVELLCAYAIREFADVRHAEEFAAICRAHHTVLPTESYSRASDASRLVEITSLQQRAKALETELRQRALLEQRLREALEQRERLLEEERAARAEAERARLVAQEANRAKSTFLAVMSHELRTPLNAIGGYAELLGMEVFGPMADEQRGALERLRQSQRHLLHLIDQVLGYTDAESGVTRYEITDVRLADVLDSVEAGMMPSVRARGLTYARIPATMSLTLRADGPRVRQILLNLMSNAVKFTEPGGRVEIEAVASGGRVLIHVRDTGMGIPREDLATIFEPFLQRDSALTRTRGGIGLGLTLSRDLARAMGGELTANSVAGQGSTFTLALPGSG